MKSLLKSRAYCMGLLLAVPFPGLAQEYTPDLSRLLFEVADPAAALPLHNPVNENAVNEGAGNGGRPPAAVPLAGLPPGFFLDQGPDAFTEFLLAQEGVTGPYAPELEEQLHSLGRGYERQGDFRRAVETLESALHVMRVNRGLFSLEQSALVQDLVRNQMALGEVREAERWRGYQYYLGLKNHPAGDPALLRAKIDWADWNIDAYYQGIPAPRTRAAEDSLFKDPVPTEIVRLSGPNSTSRYMNQRGDRGLGDLVSESALRASITSGRRIDFELNPRLRTASEHYEEVAAVLAGAANLPDTLLRENARKLANSAFIVKQGFDVMVSSAYADTYYGSLVLQELYDNPVVRRGYEGGREALESLRRRAREDPGASALATLELADWDLSYDREASARALYRQAWETLSRAGYGEEEMRALANPRPLVEIPVFATHFFSRRMLGIAEEEEIAWQGFINFEVDVDAAGRLTRIEPLSVSAGTPTEIIGALLGRLDMARVRPVVSAEGVAARERLNVRYYYSFLDR